MLWVLEELLIIEPDLPADEVSRLAALHELFLLDTPPDPYVDALLRIAKSAFGVRSVLVSLIDSERQWYKSRIGILSLEGPRSTSFCGHVILSDELMVVNDALQDVRFADNPMVVGPPEVRFYAGMPLHARDGSRIGTFCLNDPQPHTLTDEQMQLMKDFAKLIEGLFAAHQLRFEKQGLLEALGHAERRALIDPLTQLWNRQALQQISPSWHRRAVRDSLQVGFIYGDLDFFKRINDEHGHGIGDDVLVQAGQRLTAAIRPDDVAFRLGGEELGVLALVESQTELVAIAERVRKAFCDSEFVVDGQRLAVTISLGTAIGSDPLADDIDDLVERADAALYAAKGNGRNRVENG